MSLRARLALVVILAALALAAAFAALAHVVTSTDTARWARAEESADAIASAFADSLSRGDSLESAGARSLGQTFDADVGTCVRGGAVDVVASTRQPPGPRPIARPAPPLPPDQRDTVASLCERESARGRIEHPNDFLAIAVRPSTTGEVWAIRRVPRLSDPDAQSWHVEAFVLAIATLVLVVVTVSAMLALHKGIRTLETSLAELEEDLSAAVAIPRATELARIARRIQTMSTHLRSAQAREVALGRELARGERLRALGRVSAGLAHEIRNPLAAMKLRLDVLERSGEIETDAGRETLRVCRDEILRLDRIVTTLLDIARGGPLEIHALDLASIVAARIAVASPAAAARGVTLDQRGTASARGDADAVARIVENLLRNAIEVAPAGSTVRVELDGKSLAVVDEGPGVPPDDEDKLFEPFFTTKPDGTGLGLWMARTLAEAQGGTLRYNRASAATRMELTLG